MMKNDKVMGNFLQAVELWLMIIKALLSLKLLHGDGYVGYIKE